MSRLNHGGCNASRLQVLAGGVHKRVEKQRALWATAVAGTRSHDGTTCLASHLGQQLLVGTAKSSQLLCQRRVQLRHAYQV